MCCLVAPYLGTFMTTSAMRRAALMCRPLVAGRLPPVGIAPKQGAE